MKGFLLKNKWKRILSLAMASSMIFSTMSTALATTIPVEARYSYLNNLSELSVDASKVKTLDELDVTYYGSSYINHNDSIIMSNIDNSLVAITESDEADTYNVTLDKSIMDSNYTIMKLTGVSSIVVYEEDEICDTIEHPESITLENLSNDVTKVVLYSDTSTATLNIVRDSILGSVKVAINPTDVDTVDIVNRIIPERAYRDIKVSYIDPTTLDVHDGSYTLSIVEKSNGSNLTGQILARRPSVLNMELDSSEEDEFDFDLSLYSDSATMFGMISKQDACGNLISEYSFSGTLVLSSEDAVSIKLQDTAIDLSGFDTFSAQKMYVSSKVEAQTSIESEEIDLSNANIYIFNMNDVVDAYENSFIPFEESVENLAIPFNGALPADLIGSYPEYVDTLGLKIEYEGNTYYTGMTLSRTKKSVKDIVSNTDFTSIYEIDDSAEKEIIKWVAIDKDDSNTLDISIIPKDDDDYPIVVSDSLISQNFDTGEVIFDISEETTYTIEENDRIHEISVIEEPELVYTVELPDVIVSTTDNVLRVLDVNNDDVVNVSFDVDGDFGESLVDKNTREPLRSVSISSTNNAKVMYTPAVGFDNVEYTIKYAALHEGASVEDIILNEAMYTDSVDTVILDKSEDNQVTVHIYNVSGSSELHLNLIPSKFEDTEYRTIINKPNSEFIKSFERDPELGIYNVVVDLTNMYEGNYFKVDGYKVVVYNHKAPIFNIGNNESIDVVYNESSKEYVVTSKNPDNQISATYIIGDGMLIDGSSYGEFDFSQDEYVIDVYFPFTNVEEAVKAYTVTIKTNKYIADLDYSNLLTLIIECDTIVLNKTLYSSYNFDEFVEKLAIAKEMASAIQTIDEGTTAITQTDIDNITTELKDLKDSLVNISEFLDRIAVVEAWSSSEAALVVNQDALLELVADIASVKEQVAQIESTEVAETIVSSLESKKEEVALSTPEVDNSEAIAALKEELTALVSEANSILAILDSDSPEKHFIFVNGLTKEAFEVEVTSAEEVLANAEPTIEDLTEAVNSLKDSIANIVDITEQKAIYDAIKAEFEEIKADSTGYSEEKIAMASDAIMGLEVALNNYNPEDTSSWDDALANAQAKMEDLKNSYTAPAPPLTVEDLLAKMQEQYDRYVITKINAYDYNDRSWELYRDHFAVGREKSITSDYDHYWMTQKNYDSKYAPLYGKCVVDILNQVDKSNLTVELLQIWVEEGEIYHNGLLNVKDINYELDDIYDELNDIEDDIEHYTERLYDIADDQYYRTCAAIASANSMNVINVAMDQLRTAMEDLRNSYSGEVNVDKTALEREIAEAKPTYDTGNANGKYSTETWENFVEAYENAQTVLLSAKLQVQLDNAASRLNDAFNNLIVVTPDTPTPEEPKFDTSALAAKVAEVKPVYDIGNETLIYTLESWDAFDKAYRAATALLEPEATIESQEVVDRALATLTTAYASLVLDTPENPEDNISYAALEAIIAANSTIYNNGNVNTDGSQKYTVSSWNAFVTAYDSAVAMAEAKNAASQDIVNNLVSVLTNAKNSLELFVPETEIVDKAALEAALAKYKDLYDGNNSNGKYTETSFKLFKNAYAAALLEKDSSSSTKESVANAVKILDNMFKQLIPADMGGSDNEGEGQNPGGSGNEGQNPGGSGDTVVVDTSKLKATVDANRGTYNTNNLTGVYTETSFARFKVAFEMAVDVLNNPKASQEVVDLTLSQLESAIKGMTLAGSNDQYNVTVYSEDVNLRPGSILDSPFVYTVSKFPYKGNSTLIFRIKTPGFVSQNHDIKLLVDGNPAAGLSLSTTNLTMANRPVENGSYADLIFKLNWSVANPMSADTPVRLVIDGRTVFFDDLDMTILAANAPEDTQKPDEDETQKPDDTQKPDKDETQKPDEGNTQKPDKDEDDDDKESIVSRVFSLRDVGEEIEAMAKGDVLELELWPKTAISVDVLNILKDSSKTLSFVNEESDLPYVWSIYGKDIRTTNLKKDAYSLLIDFDDESYFSGDLEDILYENCVVAEFEHGSTRFSSQIAIDTEFNRKEINIYQVIDEDDEILEWVGSTKSTNKGIVEFETDEYGTIVLSTRLLPKAYVVNYNDSLGKDDTTNEGTTDVTIDGSIVSIPNSSINADGTISINGKDMTIEELEDALNNGDITEEQIEDLLDAELDGFMSLLESIFGGIFNGTGEVVGGEINGGAVTTPSRPGGQVSNAVTGGLSTQVLEDRVDDTRDDVIRAGVATICVVAFAGAVTLVLLKKRTEEE